MTRKLYCSACNKIFDPELCEDIALLDGENGLHYQHMKCYTKGKVLYYKRSVQLQELHLDDIYRTYGIKEINLLLKEIKQILQKYGCKVLYSTSEYIRMIYPASLPNILAYYEPETYEYFCYDSFKRNEDLIIDFPNVWRERRIPKYIFLDNPYIFPALTDLQKPKKNSRIIFSTKRLPDIQKKRIERR